MDTFQFKRVGQGEDTAWAVIHGGCVIGHLKRRASLGRGYSKSQMSTRHIYVWAGTVASIDALDDGDRRAVERELRRRDKATRETAADYMIAAYRAANVRLPTDQTDSRRAA
jgi:uncharacterized protein HemY